jgi:hypothetical protein
MPSSSYEKVALLHACQGTRHFWGLFLEASKDISFYIVNPVKQLNQAKAVNFKTIFLQQVAENLPEGDQAQYMEGGWEVTGGSYFTELTPALRAIDQKLQEYKQRYKGAAIAIVQSELPPAKLQFMGLPTLVSDFPIMRIKPIAAD